MLSIHLFKSPFPRSLTVHLTTYSCESSLLKPVSVLNGSVSFYRLSAPPFFFFYESRLLVCAGTLAVCVLPPTATPLTSLSYINVFGVVVKGWGLRLCVFPCQAGNNKLDLWQCLFVRGFIDLSLVLQ